MQIDRKRSEALDESIATKEREVKKVIDELTRDGVIDDVDRRVLHSADADRKQLAATTRAAMRRRKSLLTRIKLRLGSPHKPK